MNDDLTDKLKTIFGERLKEHEPLSKHVNYRIGGPARWFVEARTEEELMAAIEAAKAAEKPYFVLGGGSNTLASDEGFDGVLIKMAMRDVTIDGNRVTAGAGAISAAVARQTATAGLKGLEWAISLPGTIGGAVRGNAGCFGGEVRDNLVSARLLRGGQVVEVTSADLAFGYRESALKHSDDILLTAAFELEPGDAEVLKAKLDENLSKRKASQPLYAGSAGCMFKNYEIQDDEELQRLEQDGDIPMEMLEARRIAAGWIIDALDLKGKQIGDAKVSEEHGNFIVNLGNATASDIIQLISLIKMKARDRYGIQLQEEVQYLGF